MSQKVLIHKRGAGIKVYGSRQEACEKEGIPMWKLAKMIGGSEWFWRRRVYKVYTKGGECKLCEADDAWSKWWVPLDGSALKKKDVENFYEVTEEFLARSL